MSCVARLKNKSRALLCWGTVVAVVTGFVAAEVGIFAAGQFEPLSRDSSCPTINLTAQPSFHFHKQVMSMWHWRYTSSDVDGVFEHRCPTWKHNTQLALNGASAGRTSVAVLSAVSATDVLDCHDDVVFTWDTGDMFTSIINSFKVSAKYVIRSGSGDVIAYVSGDTFVVDDIDVRSVIDGSRVANMRRNRFALAPWSWDYTVFNASHPAASVLLMTMITGQLSFEGRYTDSCNNFFAIIGFTVVAFASFMLCVVLVSGYGYWKKKPTPLRPVNDCV
jgi:hypothetical protein